MPNAQLARDCGRGRKLEWDHCMSPTAPKWILALLTTRREDQMYLHIIPLRRAPSKSLNQTHVLWWDESREKRKLHDTSFLAFLLSLFLNQSLKTTANDDAAPGMSDNHHIIPCICFFEDSRSESVDVGLEVLDGRLLDHCLKRESCGFVPMGNKPLCRRSQDCARPRGGR
jgi:hypothetical protein